MWNFSDCIWVSIYDLCCCKAVLARRLPAIKKGTEAHLIDTLSNCRTKVCTGFLYEGHLCGNSEKNGDPLAQLGYVVV